MMSNQKTKKPKNQKTKKPQTNQKFLVLYLNSCVSNIGLAPHLNLRSVRPRFFCSIVDTQIAIARPSLRGAFNVFLTLLIHLQNFCACVFIGILILP